MNKPKRYAFIFGKDRTGCMSRDQGDGTISADDLKKHPQAKLAWYDAEAIDAYIAELLKSTPKGCSSCFDNGQIVGYEQGLTKGRAEGQVKLDAYIESIADAGEENTTGWDAPPVPYIPPPSDKATKQLLNELYHDRARLERVVQQFVGAANQTNDDILALVERVKTGGKLKDYIHNVQICGTILATFSDLYGDKS